jgi:hypothetical protein
VLPAGGGPPECGPRGATPDALAARSHPSVAGCIIGPGGAAAPAPPGPRQHREIRRPKAGTPAALAAFREDDVRKLLKRIEAAFAAVAFAEEGEFETARRVLDEDGDEPATPAGTPRSSKARAPRQALPRQKIARLP